MSAIQRMPIGGFVVIVIIVLLLVLAVGLLFYVYHRYRTLESKKRERVEYARDFLDTLYASFVAAYKKYGRDVNTPAIISETVSNRLSGLLLCERFLNNAVSLFVTLGLFGTFLGLSMSVSSLTELLSYSSSSEWLNIMDSVGGGLLSALSGMGVAFYTSLAGAGASILLTILRTIFSPAAERERLEVRLELWLDTEVAPGLATDAVEDEAHALRKLSNTLSESVGEIKTALNAASTAYAAATRASAVSMAKTLETAQAGLVSFDKTVGVFNNGVHDFTEVDYNLRGSVERMDLVVRDLSSALREINRRLNGGTK